MTDALGETTGIIKSFLPKVGGAGKAILGWGAWIIVIIIFSALIGFGVWFFIREKKFNKKIVVFEKIGNRFEPTMNDKAMEVKFSTGGDTIFYLRKSKKYLPNPRIQTGKRTYWYWIREDGEWINFGPGDFDADARQLHAHFLDKEMRFARTQIQKGLRERYDKPGFWKQYGTLVLSLSFIALIGALTWMLFDKWIALAGATNAGVETAAKVMDKANQILSSMNNICQGGSGYAPVGG